MSTPINRFWLSRFARIGPAYYLSLVIAAPAFVYGAFVAKTVPLGEFFSALVAVPAFLQSLFPPLASTWNLPAWSLSVEATLYAAFPLLMPLCFRWRLRPTIAGAIALVVLCSLVRRIFFIPVGSDSWRYFVLYFPAFHIPQFILGIVTCRLFLFGPRISDSIRRLIFIAGALVVIAIFATGTSRWTRSDLVLAPLFAAIIFGATYAKGGSARILASPVFVLLGHSSYALYVLHAPLGFWWHQLSRFISLSPWIDCCLYLCFILGVTVVTFLLFERPLRARLLQVASRSLDRRAQNVAALA